MTPGPTLIKRCPHCTGLVRQFTLMSGNTFGAVYWTDGRRQAPMLPDLPWLVLCPHCGGALWVDELEEVGRLDPWGEGPSFKGAEDGRVPQFPDFLRLAEALQAHPEKLDYLRRQAWWTGNDARRHEGEAEPLSTAEVANLRALLALEESEEPGSEAGLLSRAEMLRELGRFEEAAALLSRPLSRDFEAAAEVLRGLIARKDSRVRRLH